MWPVGPHIGITDVRGSCYPSATTRVGGKAGDVDALPVHAVTARYAATSSRFLVRKRCSLPVVLAQSFDTVSDTVAELVNSFLASLPLMGLGLLTAIVALIVAW